MTARRASGSRGEAAPVHQLPFERGPERLRHGVVLARPDASDRLGDLVLGAQGPEVPAHVLSPAVVVEDHAGGISTSGGDGHLESALDELTAHVVGHRVADDPTTADIEDVGQVEPALAGGYVGDVPAGALPGLADAEVASRPGPGAAGRSRRGWWCGPCGVGRLWRRCRSRP